MYMCKLCLSSDASKYVEVTPRTVSEQKNGFQDYIMMLLE